METAFHSDERFSPAQFFDWLQERSRNDNHHYELLGGVIVMTPPAAARHASIGANIVAELVIHARRTGAGRVLDSTAGYELPSQDIVEPDVSFISSATLAQGSPLDPAGFCHLVPALVVEVLSPSTARRDRTEKKDIYARNAVEEYWIVDPDARRVTVFRLTGVEYGAPLEIVQGSVQSSVLPGLAIPLETIFAGCD